MATYDYDGSGREREIRCSAYTLMLYEQTFKTGLIEDVFGKVRINTTTEEEDGTTVLADYTLEHWGAYIKALWAMLRTGVEVAKAERRAYEDVPSFDKWAITATNLDISEISRVVITRCQEDLFRAGAAREEEQAAE